MGAYRWQEVETSTHNARNVKKYADNKRKSGVRTRQARFFDAGETSEARYARLKREEKEAKAKAFAEESWSHYEEQAAEAEAETETETETETEEGKEEKGGDDEAVVASITAATARVQLEENKGKGPET